MARQSGLIKLNGTIGGITFYKSQDGHLAREKGGVEASRIANDPNFQRTRENGAAGKAGKLLRTAFRNILQNSADNRMVGRLTSEMVKVIQADLTSVRGLRNVLDGETELLTGFEFNIKGKLGNALYAPFTATIDRVAGTLVIDLASFIPANMIAAPSGTTHFKIESAGAEVDFENETFVVDSNDSAIIAWNTTATAALTLTNTVTSNSTSPLFLLLGVEFFQEVNGQMYPLKNGVYNPLAIVKVDGN